LVSAEVEVIDGDLGRELTQLLFDRWELRDTETGTLVDELDEVEALDVDNLEQVVRLCYRAEWSGTEGRGPAATSSGISRELPGLGNMADPIDSRLSIRYRDRQCLCASAQIPSPTPVTIRRAVECARRSRLRRS
jgi:hypothetical protein